jgi:hypothetical protein
MNFEFSLKEVEGRLFLHSVLTLESGEKSEKDLSVLVSSSVEEAHPDRVPLTLSDKVVVWIHPSDLQSIVSETYDSHGFIRMDESQVKSLIKVGNLFEKTIPLSLREKEILAEELRATLHETVLLNRDFAKRSVIIDENLFPYVGAELKSDMRFFLDVYEMNPRILRFVPTELVDRREFVEFMAEKLARHEIDFSALPASILSSEWFVGVLLNHPIERKRMEEFSQLNSSIRESSRCIFQLFLLKPECMRFVTNNELDKDFFREACVSVVEKLAQDCAAILPDPGDHTVPIPFYGDLSRDLKKCKDVVEKILIYRPDSIRLLIEDPEVSKYELKKIAAKHVVHYPLHADYFSHFEDFDLTYDIDMVEGVSIEQLEVLSDSFPRLGLIVNGETIPARIMENLQKLVNKDYSSLFSEDFKKFLDLKTAKKEEYKIGALYHFEHKSDFTRLKKGLAHVAGIGGFSDGVQLEGDFGGFYEKKIADTSLAIFPEDLGAVYQKPFEEASIYARSSKRVLAEYQKGNPILINSGYGGKTKGHFLILFLQGEHLMICNRGNRDMEFTAMSYHQIDPTKVDETLIEFLLQSKGVENAEAQNLLIYHFLPNRIAKEPKDEELKRLIEEHVKTKHQVVGNCACSSPKAAFKALAFFHYFNQLSDRPIEDRVKEASLMANSDTKKMSIALRKTMEEQIQHDPTSREIYDISRIKTLKMQLKYTTDTFDELEKVTKEFLDFVSTSSPEILKTLPEFDKLVRLLIRKRREMYPRLGKEIGAEEGIFAFVVATCKICSTYVSLQGDDFEEIFQDFQSIAYNISAETVMENAEWLLFIDQHIKLRKLYLEEHKHDPAPLNLFQHFFVKTNILKLWFLRLNGEDILEIFSDCTKFFTEQRITKDDVEANPYFHQLAEELIIKGKRLLEGDERLLQILSLEAAVFELLFLKTTPDILDQSFHLFESHRAGIPDELKREFPKYQDFLIRLKQGFEECGISDERYTQINEELIRLS